MVKVIARGWVIGGAIAGAVLYASVAILSGFDRRTAMHRQLASRVPDLFAVNALAVTTEEQISSSPQEAIRLAKMLVSRAPMEPYSTALLGEAYLAAGDDKAAERAFRVAAQLGWKVPATQAYWLDRGLQERDYRLAAIRLDALVRLEPKLLNSPEILTPFENDPEAQNQLVSRLASHPPWLFLYVGALGETPAPALAKRVPSLLMLADRGVVLGCKEISRARRTLTLGGFVREAETLWKRHCPGA